MNNKYKIVCKHPVTGQTLHEATDFCLSTKVAAKEMVGILKLVNPSLKYEIQRNELKEKP